MPFRITQETGEVSSGATASLRVTQEVAESVSGATSTLRLTQAVAESVSEATANLRVTQLAAEVVVDAAFLNVTQLAAEVVLDAPGGGGPTLPLPTQAGIVPLQGQRRLLGNRLTTPITVNAGGFTDCLGNPIANGYLLLTLSADSLGSGANAGVVLAGQSVRVHLDAKGNIASGGYFVWPTALISPAGSFYFVKLYKANGTFAFTREYTMTVPDFTPHNIALLLSIS